jgi:heme A synthase
MLDSPRPVPRWLHVWAVLTVIATLALLALGQFVTSFGAGMADPVWPTEPWYVFSTASDAEKARFKEDFAFFIEHTHRIVGFTVGGLVTILALGIWLYDPRHATKWPALLGLAALLAGYGDLHRQLMAQRDPGVPVEVPFGAIRTAALGFVFALGIAALGFVFALGIAVRSYLAGARGAGLRIVATLALAAVMVQGLLGGFRVKLNVFVGTDLAAYHGVFAQVVFALLVSVAALTGKPRGSGSRYCALLPYAALVAALMFVQIALGAWVRHFPAALPQRLHFLTAFLATAATVWLVLAVRRDPDARDRAGWIAKALAHLLILQLILGVEAWMARFGQYTLPELVKVTPQSGAIRSLHALIGSGVWAASVALAVRLRKPPAPVADKLSV